MSKLLFIPLTLLILSCSNEEEINVKVPVEEFIDVKSYEDDVTTDKIQLNTLVKLKFNQDNVLFDFKVFDKNGVSLEDSPHFNFIKSIREYNMKFRDKDGFVVYEYNWDRDSELKGTKKLNPYGKIDYLTVNGSFNMDKKTFTSISSFEIGYVTK